MALMTIDEALALARDHFQAGRLAEGQEVCEAILRSEPHDFDAHRLLGLIACAAGKATRRSPIAPNWPIYAAGVEQDDEVRELDGQRINGDSDVSAVLGRHKPGDRISITFVDRTRRAKTATMTLAENPALEVVPVDSPTAAQKSFRDAWLGSRVQN